MVLILQNHPVTGHWPPTTYMGNTAGIGADGVRKPIYRSIISGPNNMNMNPARAR
jgi:hypothetical protein